MRTAIFIEHLERNAWVVKHAVQILQHGILQPMPKVTVSQGHQDRARPDRQLAQCDSERAR